MDKIICGIVKQVANKFILWTSVILEKLNLPQRVKKFSVFYGTRRFISIFTRARDCPCPETEQSSLHQMLFLEDLF